MTAHGATVPIAAPALSRSGIYSGRPVRGGSPQWAGMALAANHLLGRGGALIPHTMVVQPLVAAATKTLRFKVWPRLACRRRLWISTYRTKGTANCSTTFTDPSGGTLVYGFSTGASGGIFQVEHVEDVSAPSASETEVAPTWALSAASTGSPELLYVACYELPRPDLTTATAEYGVDVDSLRPNGPIYAANGKSVLGVSIATQQAETIAQRAGLFQFARDTGSALSSTAAAYEAVFLADAVPVLLGRKLYTTSTVRKLQVRAYCRAGATTVGKVRFTMTSGASLVLDITSGMAAAWLSGDLDVDCEDLSVSDGRRSARYDKCTIEFYRVSGANSVYIESISIGNG